MTTWTEFTKIKLATKKAQRADKATKTKVMTDNLRTLLKDFKDVLTSLRDWNNSDDLLWIQYRQDAMLANCIAVEESMFAKTGSSYEKPKTKMHYTISIENLQELANYTNFSTADLTRFMNPVRRMSDKEIFNLVEYSKNVEGVLFLPFSFAREIENHILGENE